MAAEHAKDDAARRKCREAFNVYQILSGASIAYRFDCKLVEWQRLLWHQTATRPAIETHPIATGSSGPKRLLILHNKQLMKRLPDQQAPSAGGIRWNAHECSRKQSERLSWQTTEQSI